MNTKALRANLLLLLAAMIWGAAFVAQRTGSEQVGPFTFLCTRSVLGGLALLPIIALRGRHEKKPDPKEPGISKTLLIAGAACGSILFLASMLQQVGIQETTAGKAGFLTAMYMVLVPIAGLLWGKHPGARVWCSVGIALVGMYLLCFSGGGFQDINRGDLLELACAFGFTAHILVIDHFSDRVDGVKMSCIQFFVCAFLAFWGMLWEAPSSEALLAAWLPIAYAGLLSSGAGYTLQIVAQKDTAPTIASLLMSLESVFSLVFGWIILHEAMMKQELFGCVLMFAAIVWVQLPGKTEKTEEKAHDTSQLL